MRREDFFRTDEKVKELVVVNLMGLEGEVEGSDVRGLLIAVAKGEEVFDDEGEQAIF